MKNVYALVIGIFLLIFIVVLPSLITDSKYLLRSTEDATSSSHFTSVAVANDENLATTGLKTSNENSISNDIEEPSSLIVTQPPPPPTLSPTAPPALEVINCVKKSNATAMQQEIRELKGEIAALKGTAQAKIQNTIQTEADLWADTTQILQREKYNCLGPGKNATGHEDPLWEPLRKNSRSGKVCGCLIPYAPRKYNSDSCKSTKSVKLDKEFENCPLLWIMTIGDSTMLQWNSWFMSIIMAAGYYEQKWRPTPSDDDEIKISMTKLRKALSSSGRLGVHLNFEDDYLYVHEKTGHAILLSARTAMGMSLSKWMATIKNPLKQIQVPHLPGGGSIVQHPSLDEPYFIDAGSQAIDFLHDYCKGDFTKMAYQLSHFRKPDLVVGGSALWDTGGDSNMQHRNEVHRCGMRLPVLKTKKNDKEESMVMQLYRRRLYNLFNTLCEEFGNTIFTWRTSGLGSRIIEKINKIEVLPDDVINYSETAALNDISRAVAAEFGIPVFDYELIHKKYKYKGVDSVHPSREVVFEGTKLYLEEALERGTKNGMLSSLQQKILGELIVLASNGTEVKSILDAREKLNKKKN